VEDETMVQKPSKRKVPEIEKSVRKNQFCLLVAPASLLSQAQTPVVAKPDAKKR
jgi:hypothetical protein